MRAFLSLLLCCFAVAAQAQTSISPTPIQHFVDNNGNALNGGKLFIYQAGTTTKATTYTDSTLGTPNTDPIILNSRGEPENSSGASIGIWSGPATLKYVLSPPADTDPPTNPIWTLDNIPFSLTQLPLNITQTFTGNLPEFYADKIVITDNASVTTGSTFGNGLGVFQNYGGPAAKGGRVAIEGMFTLTSPTSAANVNRNYVGIYGLATANTPDNGVSGAPEGGIFAFAALVTALSGATNLLELAGSEINVDAETGSSMYGKFGWTIVSMPTDAVHGTVEAMLGLSNQTGAVGWSNGILFSPFNGVFPIDIYGSLLSTIGDVGGSTILNGFDLSGVTVSGCALKLLISGAGQCAISGRADIETEGNIGLTTGATSYYFYGPSFTHPALRVIPNPAGVNYAAIEGNTAGNPPAIKATGTDTNVNLDLEGQGTGLLEFANASSWSANGSVGTTMTGVGPSGSHTTVQEWFAVVDSAGITRYIPAY